MAATFKLESFIGKATVAIDAAGRTNFPKEFRKILKDEAGGQVMVTIGGANTLALYPVYEWNATSNTIEESPEAAKGGNLQVPHPHHRHGQALGAGRPEPHFA